MAQIFSFVVPITRRFVFVPVHKKKTNLGSLVRVIYHYCNLLNAIPSIIILALECHFGVAKSVPTLQPNVHPIEAPKAKDRIGFQYLKKLWSKKKKSESNMVRRYNTCQKVGCASEWSLPTIHRQLKQDGRLCLDLSGGRGFDRWQSTCALQLRERRSGDEKVGVTDYHSHDPPFGRKYQRLLPRRLIAMI